MNPASLPGAVDTERRLGWRKERWGRGVRVALLLSLWGPTAGLQVEQMMPSTNECHLCPSQRLRQKQRAQVSECMSQDLNSDLGQKDLDFLVCHPRLTPSSQVPRKEEWHLKVRLH